MLVLTRLFSIPTKSQLKRHITYIICFSLCMTSPGFTSLALSQSAQTINQADQSEEEENTDINNQDEDYEDNLSLLNHPLYQQISDLDREVTKQYQAACCKNVPGVDSSNLEPLDVIMQRYQFIKLSVEDQLNKPVWQSLREYCPYQSQESLPQECTLMIESLFSQDKLQNQIMSIMLDDQLERTFFEYLIEYCRETYPQGQCPLMASTDLSSIEYFALPPSFNEHEILKDRLSKIFLQHFIEEFLEGFLEACSNQSSLPEECVQIEEHAKSPFFDNNIMFIGLTLSIAHKIILTQIYSGNTINEIDFSPFTLSINQNMYSDKEISEGCAENTDSLNSEFQEKSGILLRTKTKYEYDGGQCYYNIQLNPSSFVEFQLAIETSKDSDHSLIQLVFYPLLENYYENLLNIQRLKGIGFENINSPNVSLLPQDTSFPINASIRNMIFKETREQRYLKPNFRDALIEAYNVLIDNNANRLSTRLFTDDVLNDLADEIETPISDNLRKSVHRAEFSLDFTTRVTLRINDYSEDLYCTSCHTLEDYKEVGLHKTLMLIFLDSKFLSIRNNALLTEDGRLRPGVDPKAAQTIQSTYFSIQNPLARDEQPPAKYLGLLESLESLVDQWIEKALEIMVSSREQFALQAHQDYIEEIIQEANRISLVNDTRLSTYALYQAVISQKDFPIHPEASALLNTLFLGSPSYTDARILFNALLQDSSRLVELTDDDINSIFFESIDDSGEQVGEVIDQSNLEGNLGEQTGEGTDQTASESNLDERSKQETVFSTTNQNRRQQVIDPNQIREALEKVTPTTFNTSILQKSAEQNIDAQKRLIEYLLAVGKDMGFFNESLLSDTQFEEEPVSLIRDTVFSRLGPPQRGLLNPCNYTPSLFFFFFLSSFCDSNAQVYLDIYKEGQKNEILNKKHRILSDRYSPVAGKPLFEIIQDNCNPEMDQQVCRSRVSNIMIKALERQEQDIKNNFQELMTDLTSEDPSEALRKVMFALEEDEEQGGTLTNIRLQLEQNDLYRAQFDFHSDRLQGHLTPSDREKFVQNYIDTPIDNLMNVLYLLILRSFIGGVSKGLAVPAGRLGYNSKALAMRRFASRNNSRGWSTAVFMPLFVYTTGRNIHHHFNEISPKADFVEDLYYISPQQSLLVDQSQFLMSEQLEDDSYFNTITIPIMIVAGLIGFYASRPVLNWWRNKSLTKQVISLEGHFEKLGINLPASKTWSNISPWDMRALKEKVNLLRQHASNSREERSLRKSWGAIDRFYNRQTGRARRLMEARRQLGAPTNISNRDVMKKHILQQVKARKGDPTHLRNLQKILQREDDLFELQKYNTGAYPIIQSFFEHLRTLP